MQAKGRAEGRGGMLRRTVSGTHIEKQGDREREAVMEKWEERYE